MPRHLALLVLALTVDACSDDPGTSGATASTSGAATTSGAASDAAATTTAAESGTSTDTSTDASITAGSASSTSASSTSASSTADTTSTSTSTTTTNDPTTTAGTTAGADVDFYAFALFGGLDRIVIRKANHDTGHCTELRLVAPADLGTLAITTPRGWAVEAASIHDTLDGCLAPMPVAGAVEWALTGQGEVTWTLPPMQIYPCALDLDVTLDFPPMTWAPPADPLVAVGLEIVGAC